MSGDRTWMARAHSDITTCQWMYDTCQFTACRLFTSGSEAGPQWVPMLLHHAYLHAPHVAKENHINDWISTSNRRDRRVLINYYCSSRWNHRWSWKEHVVFSFLVCYCWINLFIVFFSRGLINHYCLPVGIPTLNLELTVANKCL